MSEEQNCEFSIRALYTVSFGLDCNKDKTHRYYMREAVIIKE
jgi:hypothetical protein